MNRTRARTVALGLAFVAGELRAAADDPAFVQPAAAFATPAPRLLPAEMRRGEWATAGSNDPATVWFPARDRVPPVVVRPDVAPDQGTVPPLIPASLMPATIPPAANPKPIGSRLESQLPLPGRSIQLPDRPIAAPSVPLVQPTPANRSGSNDWRPIEPANRPIVEPTPQPRLAMLPQSVPPEPPRPNPQPTPLAVPTRVAETIPAATCELPTAPMELMRPVGWKGVGKHNTFGSTPIQISRDYPPLSDLVKHDSLRGLRSVEAGGAAVDRLQFQAEYLLWWMTAAQYPALATTTSAPGAVPSLAAGNGFLGDPTTSVLLGDGTIGGRQRQGLRLRAGWWFDDCGTCGIDASYFVLGRKTDTFSYTSDASGSPVITRPFFAPNVNPITGQIIGETGEIVAFPNFSAGTLTVQTASSLWGADLNFRRACARSCDFESFWFAGFRFLSLSDSLQITEYINTLPGNAADPLGTQVVVQDQFQTRNRFYGAQVGGSIERNRNRVSIGMRGSLALGTTHQEVTIDGAQLRNRPGIPPATFQGGLLAAGPNLGSFTSNHFSVVPEATFNIGYWLTPNMKVYAGYNVLYWSNVVRPGDSIDRVVDVTFVPNPPPGIAASGLNRPQPQFQQSSLWVQGIQLGMEWRW